MSKSLIKLKFLQIQIKKANNAKDFGTKAPFLRSDFLAKDKYLGWLPWQHAPSYYELRNNFSDILILLRATRPF